MLFREMAYRPPTPFAQSTMATAEAYRVNQCGASLDATLASLLVKLGKVQTFNLERLLYTWW